MPTDIMKAEVTKRVMHLIEIAKRDLNIIVPTPIITYTQKGTAAGSADFQHWLLKFNPILLRDNFEEFIEHTVGHEVAHLTVFKKYGDKVQFHGAQWKRIMKYFNLPSRINHSYDLSKINQYVWNCSCSIHHVSSAMHRKMILGESYSCTACHEILRQQ